MSLRIAPKFAGRRLSFQDRNGRPVVIEADEEGYLSTIAMTPIVRDGDGNELEVVEVEHERAGEPSLFYFRFEGDIIPPELADHVEKVGRRNLVPARYVRGVHTVKEMVELDAELVEDLLADTSLAPFLREEADADAEEGREDVQEAEEAQEEE